MKQVHRGEESANFIPVGLLLIKNNTSIILDRENKLCKENKHCQ